MTGWTQEIQGGFRLLWKDLGFTAIVVLCLGLCIGVNTAGFSLMNELFFRPLPVPDADRLVRLSLSYTSGLRWGAFSHPDYVDYEDQNTVLSGMLLEMATPLDLGIAGGHERLWGAVVSENYFSVLEVAPAVGRSLGSTNRSAEPSIVLSHGLWQRRFGGDPKVVGTGVNLNGHPFTIVGIAPASFQGTSIGFSPELWAPVTYAPQLVPGRELLYERGSRAFLALGRLAPGVTLDQATAALNRLAEQFARIYPETNEGISVHLMPEGEGGLHPSLRSSFLAAFTVLQILVILVLIVACANVAALLLVRTHGRRREIGVRLAVGASRGRLIWQLLVENSLLALLGGALGLGLAFWINRLVRSFNPTNLPIFFELGLDGRVLGFTLAVSILTVLVFGLMPALRGTQLDLASTLKSGGATVGGHRMSRLRSLLVGGQILVSVLLLIVAGLFLRSLRQAETVDPGFTIDGVLAGSLDLGLLGYDEDRGRNFYREITRRLNEVSAVRAATLAESLPFNLFGRTTQIEPEGYESPDGSEPNVEYNVVAPGYFRTLEIELVAGRDFDIRDDPELPDVAIINETLAERFWPGDDPLGKVLRPGVQVVGVAKDVKYSSLAEKPKPYVYLPLSQAYRPGMMILLAPRGASEGLIPILREEVRRLDEGMAVHEVGGLDKQLAMALLPARTGALLFSVFGGLGLLLAVVGLYGLVSYSVSQRRREIGVRMALGAEVGGMVRLLMRQGLRICGIGLVGGVVVSLLITRFLESLLHGVSPLDPVTFLVIPVLLGLSALLASFVATRRAVRVDMVAVLREE